MIKVGIIGIGYWGPNLVRNFIQNPHATVELVCDVNDKRLQTIKNIYPSLRVETEYKNVINSKNIDLVVVSTPVYTHFEIAKAALIAGKNVLITKPMTSTSIQAVELLNIAEQKGLKIFVDHTFIYTGAVRKIKELIEANEIGDIFYFDSVRVNLGLFQHDINVIWDLAPHDISIMHFLLNQYPESVIATGANHFKNNLEDVAYLTAYFKNNLIAHIHINWLSPVKVRQTLIAGNKKMVVWDDNQPSEKVRIYDKGIEIIRTADEVYNMLVQYRTGDMYCPKIDTTEALNTEINHIVDCITKNKAPLTDGESGLMTVKVLEAAQKSIKNRGIEVTIT